MRTFFTLLYKDFLLLVRDAAGLCLMFLMPVALVLLMTFLQNNLMDTLSETKISALLLNSDHDTLGNAIEEEMKKSESFDLQQSGKSEKELKNAVARGEYMIGIVIPQGASDSIRRHAKQAVMRGFGSGNTRISDTVQVNIYIDPTLKTSFRNTLMSTLREYAARTERDFLLKELFGELNRRIPFKLGTFALEGEQVHFNVQYAVREGSKIIPNATQHNVPAWTLFAIFFITLSLSGGIIKEREDGSFRRLLTMPCSYIQYLLSKSVVYLTVCLLQIALLFALGVWLFPQIGLPPLQLGTNAPLLLLVGVCSSSAAIGFGMLVGKIANGYQQASVFAAISVIIFAAVGGIWVPIFAMPAVMQTVSRISPLNWGLNGFYDILIRSGKFIDILPECLLSLFFAALCIAGAAAYHRWKKV